MDKNIKIWDLIFNCIFDINNIYDYEKLYCSCFLQDDYDDIYIITGIYKYKYDQKKI